PRFHIHVTVPSTSHCRRRPPPLDLEHTCSRSSPLRTPSPAPRPRAHPQPLLAPAHALPLPSPLPTPSAPSATPGAGAPLGVGAMASGRRWELLLATAPWLHLGRCPLPSRTAVLPQGSGRQLTAGSRANPVRAGPIDGNLVARLLPPTNPRSCLQPGQPLSFYSTTVSTTAAVMLLHDMQLRVREI
ncbi:unnamed protein product, partial [Urochloa humidicola]